MGVLYTLSVSGTDAVFDYMRNAWKVFAVLAVVLLPFGQRAVRCQHSNPDIFKMAHRIGIHGLFGWDYRCNGRCAESEGARQCIDNFAWSLYVVDLGCWSYVSAVFLWLVFLVSWSILVWMVICVTAIAVAVAGACACVCGGDGSVDCVGCQSFDNGGFGAGSCCECPASPENFIVYNNGGYNHDGPTPNVNRCCESRSDRCYLWRSVAWLLHDFPVAPSNLWGGLFGYVIGTHFRSPCPNQGDKWYIDRLNFQNNTDLRDDADWRKRVQQFIISFSSPGTSGFPTERPMEKSDRPLLRTSAPRLVSGKRLLQADKPFEQEYDHIVNSSFDDYMNDNCWICCGSNERSDTWVAECDNRQWHLWMQCGHMFCERCSGEMLYRQMPCPLCRRTPFAIKTGPKARNPNLRSDARIAIRRI